MSENGEIYTAGNKFYTPAGTDGMDKFHLWMLFDKLAVLFFKWPHRWSQYGGKWAELKMAFVGFVGADLKSHQ